MNCKICHTKRIPARKRIDIEKKEGERSRSEWISFIAVLKGLELGKEVQQAINTQIDYHISRQ
jgi:hypothetical protein